MVASFDTPDWQGSQLVAPATFPVADIYGLNAGVIAHIIPAQAGKRIILLGITWQRKDVSGVTIVLQDTNANTITLYIADKVIAFSEPYFGFQLATGVGLDIKNISGVNMAVSDVVTVFCQIV